MVGQWPSEPRIANSDNRMTQASPGLNHLTGNCRKENQRESEFTTPPLAIADETKVGENLGD